MELPEGWTEASPGGMLANGDPENGGIIDHPIGEENNWFAIPNWTDTILEGFATREEAFNALMGLKENRG